MTPAQEEKKSELSVKKPEILKTAEYELMIELIGKGLWRTRNLARALHVDEDTITAWKKTERVKKAHSDSILKFVGRRKDVEKILSELEVESTVDPSTLNQINIYGQLNDEQLKQLIATKSRQLGIVSDGSGIGTQAENNAAQLPETTS